MKQEPMKQEIIKQESMSKLLDFKAMHHGNELLFLPNAWDRHSALVLEKAGFNAIGTTSYGMASAMGLEDGENIPFEHFLALVGTMIAGVKIPVSVDIEAGYSHLDDIVVENVLKIANLGAAGINIEDSLKDTYGLKSCQQQCELIGNIRSKLDTHGFKDFFINARIDTYLQRQNPLEETVERAKSYLASGADGIFVPGLWQQGEIKTLVQSTDGPLNLMSLANLTDGACLQQLGVKRFSIGNALSDATQSFMENQAQILKSQQNTQSLYPSVEEMQA